MIINPREQKFGIKAGPYPVITTEDDFAEYIKDKKGTHIVELCYPLIPVAEVLGPRVIEVDITKGDVRPQFDKAKLSKDFKKKLKNKIKEKKAKDKEKK